MKKDPFKIRSIKYKSILMEVQRVGRNQYVGSWTESDFMEITCLFSKENLVELLMRVVNKSSQYTYQQICNWCDKHYMSEDGLGDEKLYRTLKDISAQWDLYLTNTFSLNELQQLDFSKVELPIEWFEDWLKGLT